MRAEILTVGSVECGADVESAPLVFYGKLPSELTHWQKLRVRDGVFVR